MASQDVADRIATELSEWLELRAVQIADAILESPYRPRVVEPSTRAATEYYRTLLLNPDGTLNEQGKAQVIQQYGPSGYEDIAKQVAKAVKDEHDQAFAAARDEAMAAITGTGSAGPTAAPPPGAAPLPLQPIPTRPPTNTSLMLGQMPDPGTGSTPQLATPGGA